MIFKELLIFGFLTISVGVLIGALFDKLIFAFLLKLMKMKVQLVSTFQPGIVVLVLSPLVSSLPFGSSQRLADSSFECSATNSWESEWWKESPLLVAPNHPGLSLSWFWLLPGFVCQRPHVAILIFFLALSWSWSGPTCSLMLGSPSSCTCLRKKKGIITNPTIWSRSLTSSIAWRKMQWGLRLLPSSRPWCWWPSLQPLTSMSVAKWSRKSWRLMISLFKEKGRPGANQSEIWWICVWTSSWDQESWPDDLCQLWGQITKGTDFTVYPADERKVIPKTVFLVFDTASYEQMTGEKADLTGNQVILFAHNKALKGQKAVHYQWQDFQVKEEVTKDFITDHCQHVNMITEDFNYLIVPDLSAFIAQFPNLAIYTNIYGGFNVNVSEDQQLKLAASYDKMIDELSSQQAKEHLSMEVTEPMMWQSWIASLVASSLSEFSCHWSLWSERSSSSTTSKSQKAMKTVTASSSSNRWGSMNTRSNGPSTVKCGRLLPPSSLPLSTWPLPTNDPPHSQSARCHQ